MLVIVLLYWALLTLSLFNTVVLLWLGSMVLLTAESRRWGVWLAACGLLAGGAVFISHSAVLMESTVVIGAELNVWWPLGWAALVFSPLAWYLAMLWHTGYWEDRKAPLRRRHLPLLLATSALAACLIALLAIAKPLPFAVKTTGFDLSTTPALHGIPLVVLLYPLFALCCISFSLDALLRPGPTRRPMGEFARYRARPWLVAASLALLIVSMLVVSSLIWLLRYGAHALNVVPDRMALSMLWFDLVITLLITAAVVLLGQAMVAYEIFTARTLPRHGLRRQWHNAIMLAGGYGLVVGGSFALELPAIYIVLLATLLVALTYALLGWRTYQERERYITHLRPFISSEHVYDSLLATEPAAVPSTGAGASFHALARDVLGAKVAYLVPTGGLRSLVTTPLLYPAAGVMSFDVDEALLKRCCAEVTSLSVEPAHYGGAIWAVPLWSARGMIGILLLGEKSDGGLYTQEDIEIARSSGERLLDSIGGASLAQRLMALQRQRFIESQVLDQQSRRALHDEILPSLHAAMLSLGGQPPERRSDAEALEQLAEVHRRISALLREMPTGLASQVGELGVVAAVRRMVETEFSREFDHIGWLVEPEAEERAKALPTLSGDVIFYAAKEVVRNAARHGRGSDPARPLRLSVTAAWKDGLEISIADDGVGVPTTAEATPATGQGLALHGTMLAVIGGSLVTESRPRGGTVATIFLARDRWEQK